MPRVLISLFVFMLAVPALAPAGAATPAPASDALAPVVTGANAQEAAPAATRKRDGKNGKQDKRDKKDKNKEKKPKPKPATCFGKKATITLQGNEETAGTDNDDVIIGDGKSNQIDLVGGGVDRVCLGGGNDRVLAPESLRLLADGGPGRDLLSGSDLGDDFLLGGDGGDALVGRGGNDDLLAGEGNDRLVGNDGLDILDGGPGVDVCLQENDSEAFNC